MAVRAEVRIKNVNDPAVSVEQAWTVHVASVELARVILFSELALVAAIVEDSLPYAHDVACIWFAVYRGGDVRWTGCVERVAGEGVSWWCLSEPAE